MFPETNSNINLIKRIITIDWRLHDSAWASRWVGNISLTHSSTIRGDARGFYRFTEIDPYGRTIGDGFGINFRGWLGMEGFYSFGESWTDLRVGGMVQITPWFHFGMSRGVYTQGLHIGFGNTTLNLDFGILAAAAVVVAVFAAPALAVGALTALKFSAVIVVISVVGGVIRRIFG